MLLLIVSSATYLAKYLLTSHTFDKIYGQKSIIEHTLFMFNVLKKVSLFLQEFMSKMI